MKTGKQRMQWMVCQEVADAISRANTAEIIRVIEQARFL